MNFGVPIDWTLGAVGNCSERGGPSSDVYMKSNPLIYLTIFPPSNPNILDCG